MDEWRDGWRDEGIYVWMDGWMDEGMGLELHG